MKKRGIVGTLIIAAIPFFMPILVLAYTSPGKPDGFVNDFANIISTETQNQLEASLSDYEKKTGNEISVVTIPSLGDETIESYAEKLFKEWGIGKADKDNGLLLLIAFDDRKMRIEVGYGLEPYITDAQASSIMRNILTPSFKAGKYEEGITSAVTTIINVLNGQADALPPETESNSEFNGNWIFWGIFIFIWLASILGRSKSWWLGGVLGGVAGVIIGFIYGFIITGITWTAILIVVGLIFDFFVSKSYQKNLAKGDKHPWWIGGGGFGGGGGGGFGGFGGGGSGGGGSSGGW